MERAYWPRPRVSRPHGARRYIDRAPQQSDNQLLSSNFIAFYGASLTGFAAGLAFGDLGEFFTFLLAVPADHRDHFGQMAGMLGIDRREGCQCAAGVDELEGRVGAIRHACVLHLIHGQAMPETIIARRNAMRSGFLKRLKFRRMHVWLFARLRKGL